MVVVVVVAGVIYIYILFWGGPGQDAKLLRPAACDIALALRRPKQHLDAVIRV